MELFILNLLSVIIMVYLILYHKHIKISKIYMFIYMPKINILLSLEYLI